MPLLDGTLDRLLTQQLRLIYLFHLEDVWECGMIIKAHWSESNIQSNTSVLSYSLIVNSVASLVMAKIVIMIISAQIEIIIICNISNH